MNFSKITLITLCFWLIPFKIAEAQQLERVKTGDKLGYELLRYDLRGREVFLAAVTPITAEIVVAPDGRTLTYNTGRVEKFDVQHTLIERTTQGQTTRFSGKQLLKWMPDLQDFKSSRKVFESYENPRCGIVDAEYESTPKESISKILISGKEVEIKVVEFLLNGKWSAGTCGIGKQTRRVIYSPDLDIVLESEFMNYMPTSGLLNVGNGVRLKSIGN